jgi:hypothetical protein
MVQGNGPSLARGFRELVKRLDLAAFGFHLFESYGQGTVGTFPVCRPLPLFGEWG